MIQIYLNKTPESSKKVKLEFATTPATILHGIYIVLGAIRNLEMI